MMTLDEFKEALPAKVRKRVNQEVLNEFNQILCEPEMAQHYRENIMTYSHILNDSNYSVGDFINAIKYTSFKMAGLTNLDSYIKTFPDRYQKHLKNGASDKDISAYVSAYNKSKLVTSIMEQAFIPTWLLNNDYFQEAITVQATIMRTAKSEKVRSDAANSLLNHLKPPEKAKVELDVTVKQSSYVDELRKAVQDLTEMQKQAIQSGNASVLDIAESRIIEGTVVDD